MTDQNVEDIASDHQQLIQRLSATPLPAPPNPHGLRYNLGRATLATVACLLLLVAILGVRPGFLDQLSAPYVPFKLAFIFSAGLYALLHMRQTISLFTPPVLIPRVYMQWILAAIAAALLLILGLEIWRVSQSSFLTSFLAAWIGEDALVCITAIPLMAAPIAFPLFLQARQGAPMYPGRAGMSLGLVAAAISATIYTLHCPNDSPLYVISWFGLAMGISALLGYMAGRKWLSW